jgi:hypothetical protein
MDHSFYTEFTPVKPRKNRKKIQKQRQSSFTLLQYVREELGRDDWVKECQGLYLCNIMMTSLTRLTCRNSGGIFERCFSRVPSRTLPWTW